MSQSLQAAINTEIKAVERLRSTFRTARYCGYTKDWINNRITEVYNNLPKRFAMSRRTTIHAIQHVLWSEMMERDLEFVYLLNGKTYSTYKNTKHHKPTHKANPKMLYENNHGGAFWWIEKGLPYESFTLR